MNKILLLFIISTITAQLHGQDTLKIDETGNGKGTQKDFRSLMRDGNRLYNGEKAGDAEKSYRKALDIDKTSDRATFNLGDALYRQEKYEEAGKAFEKAAAGTADKTDKARAYHNLGNSYLQQKEFQKSIDAYKNALRNNPDDADTKYNLSYAMNLLKKQQQQQNKPPQDQDKEEADKIVEQAKKLVAQRKYQEAYDLMKEGEKKNPKLLQHADFTNRILNIIKMN